MMILTQLYLYISKEAYRSSTLNFLTHYTLELQKPLPFILQLVNTNWGSFQIKTSAVYIDHILLNLDIMFYMIVEGSTNTRTWEEIISFILFSSQSSILMPFTKKKILLREIFFFFLVFFLFSFYLSFSISIHCCFSSI